MLRHRKPQPETVKRQRKLKLQVLAFLGLFFAAGFYASWLVRITPELFMLSASRYVPDAGGSGLVRIYLPGGREFTFDGQTISEQHVSEGTYHVVSQDEVSRWVRYLVNAEAICSGKALLPEMYLNPSEPRVLEAYLSKHRVLVSTLAGASFVGGFLLGHMLQPDFNSSEFEHALHDEAIWRAILIQKRKALQAKHDSIEALTNLAVLGYTDASPSVHNLKMNLAALYRLNPEFKQIQ